MTLRQLRNEVTGARKFESADCWPILGLVDPGFGCRGERLRNASDESLGVAPMSGGQHGGPGLNNCYDFGYHGRRHPRLIEDAPLLVRASAEKWL
jgi:hypothetical protein